MHKRRGIKRLAAAMPSADSPVVSLEGAAMPYFIYRSFESTRAEMSRSAITSTRRWR
jgi:hypothetical protein